MSSMMSWFQQKPAPDASIEDVLEDIQAVARASQLELQHHVCPNIEALLTAVSEIRIIVDRTETAEQTILGRLDRFEAYMLRVDPRYPRSHDDMTAAERAVGEI